MWDILKIWNIKDLNVIKFYINDIFEFLCVVLNKMILCVNLLYCYVFCGRKLLWNDIYIIFLCKNMKKLKICMDLKIWVNLIYF